MDLVLWNMTILMMLAMQSEIWMVTNSMDADSKSNRLAVAVDVVVDVMVTIGVEIAGGL